MPQLFYIRSSKDAAKFYAVTATGPRAVLKCECPAGTYAKKPCRHVVAVVAGKARPATLKHAA